MKYRLQVALIAGMSAALSSNAQEMPKDSLLHAEAPQVVIIAQKDHLLGSVPGSAAYIKPIALQNIVPLSGNEMLRKLPGIHVVDEEGIGLRANIGIRGLDPDRSANLLVLEDGIPVQLNPYGEPELYYTPAIDRMQAIEVVKGSGQIMFGPRTIGGVLNYITAAPPVEMQTKIGIKGGSGAYASAQISHGNTFKNAGFVLNYLYKHADKMGVTGFDVHDFNARFNLQLSEKQVACIKIQVYDEISNSTYIGLTQNMFDKGNYYPILAPDDALQLRRYALSATHKFYPSSNFRFTTNAYHYTISRNWRRQNFSTNPDAANQTGVVWGDTTISGGAIYMLDESLSRNRNFEVTGIETGLQWKYRALNNNATLDAGIRLLQEKAIEQEIFAYSPNAESGVLVNHERRPGLAVSAFVQNNLQFGARFNLHAGLRIEQYGFKREVLLFKSAPDTYRDTFISAPADVSALIPGVGFRFNLNQSALFFGGLHKGFAPPGIKNSVSKSGEIFPLEAQESWNYELGFRMAWPKGIEAELTGYLLDFQKQVISVSESSGGNGSGFANAGRTLHRGFEAAARLDFGQLLDYKWAIYWEGNATWANAQYAADRFVGKDAVNIKGNKLPYAPEWMSSQSIGCTSPKGFNLQFSCNYTGSQFTDELNTAAASANGRSGQIPAYLVFDGSCRYIIKRWNMTCSFAGKNLTNQHYIASRRPQGIKTGIPRTWIAGVEIRF